MLSGMLFSTSAVSVGAVGLNRNYTAYSLPRLKGNAYTPVHEKSTSRNFIENTVTAISNASFVYCWAINDGQKKISKKYKAGPGTGTAKIDFTKDGYNKQKVQVGLGLENYQSVGHYAFVTGYVNLY